MTAEKKRRVRTLAVAVFLLVAHEVLARVLAARESAAVLLAGGPHSAGVDVALLTCFLAIRGVVVLGLPGVLAYEIVTWLLGRGTGKDAAEDATLDVEGEAG